eukprot:TRINITY_DN2643_c0_g1_i1.p1 TRINITY_DN2643_c0_g1~~TRINITY_DN2643_c0_g1_i1.p1  ORF type:complete len:101 (+),score=4.94 TRINITY_DN2643_c0_g1_i1:58-360(+)
MASQTQVYVVHRCFPSFVPYEIEGSAILSVHSTERGAQEALERAQREQCFEPWIESFPTEIDDVTPDMIPREFIDQFYNQQKATNDGVGWLEILVKPLLN